MYALSRKIMKEQKLKYSKLFPSPLPIYIGGLWHSIHKETALTLINVQWGRKT